MKQYLVSLANIIKASVWQDVINRYLILASVIFFLVDWLIWRAKLATPDMYVYLGFGVYPIKFLAAILFLNTVLAVFSYNKEKEISYLLLIGNVIAGTLILALEIFYLNIA